MHFLGIKQTKTSWLLKAKGKGDEAYFSPTSPQAPLAQNYNFLTIILLGSQ